MKYYKIHEFPVNKREMQEIQTRFSSMVAQKSLDQSVKTISGIDISYYKDISFTAIITIHRKNHKVIDTAEAYSKAPMKYIPGYLAYRELPLILEAWEKLTIPPDLVFFDGNGFIHPRRCGLASHASFFLKKPTIGVAKKLLFGEYKKLDNIKGNFSYITQNEEKIGVAIRTKYDSKPIFVSIGNWITLQESLELTLELTEHQRLPIVLQMADLRSKELKNDFIQKSKT